jgi:hypothetical protein
MPAYRLTTVLQLAALKRARCSSIFEDKGLTGSQARRPALLRWLRSFRARRHADRVEARPAGPRLTRPDNHAGRPPRPRREIPFAYRGGCARKYTPAATVTASSTRRSTRRKVGSRPRTPASQRARSAKITAAKTPSRRAGRTGLPPCDAPEIPPAAARSGQTTSRIETPAGLCAMPDRAASAASRICRERLIPDRGAPAWCGNRET